ncbi:MAG: GGDEF domain-containing protein, partial [Oribacterium sp.]|nr:GGDEF domain-containing protein [Oribacterium sp.]
HHERYDGRGYPDGKSGENIPLIARIICVADSFDAMNTDRVYRKKLSREQIVDEIEKNKGLQFDPVIADIMLRLLRDGVITSE